MEIIHETEVLVIGAGIVGCSIAYHLARRGLSVAVVDSRAIGEGASSANMALVWVQGKQPAPYMELNLLGSRLHAKLAAEFDEDVELRQPGGIILCRDGVEFEEKLDVMERLKAGSSEYQPRVLSAAEVRELEPFVSADIAGGIYSPHDGHINPFKFISTVNRLSKSRGTRFFLHTPVLQILRNEDGVTGAKTSRGVIRADHVVVATGTAAPDLVRSLGIDLRLKFIRGQLLVTDRTERMFSHPLHGMRQTESGNILIGTTHESVGMDTSTTVEAAREMARAAIRLVPKLKDRLIIRQFSGIRPIPADGLPFIGQVKSIPGLYISVSHSGVTLAPVHGKAISDLILDGETDVPIAEYRPERFSETGTASS